MFVKHTKILFFLGVSFSFITWISFAGSTKELMHRGIELFPDDSTKKKSKTPDYTPEDRYGDPYAHPSSKSPLLLPLPSNVQTDVILDDSLNTYTIEEKVGDTEYRPSSTMTFEEYSKHKDSEAMKSYWKTKTGGDTSATKADAKSISAKLRVSNLKGPFGSDYIEIRPTGLVTLDFGARFQRVANPNIPVRLQRQGQFEFDQTISMNVVGKIGEKLKLTTNWDTKAAFEFQNNLKLEFTGYPEDIIQKIEAGNVSFPLNSTLYSGSQNLFGVKTKLQFGRLSATAVMATQRSKVEELRIQGGSQSRDFEIKADNYDDYRHFFLSQFFRDNYEKSLETTPNILSGVQITRVQVWLTNRVNNTSSLKGFVALTDLAEANPAAMQSPSPDIIIPGMDPKSAADNNANKLFKEVLSYRTAGQDVISMIQGPPLDLVRGTDFELIQQARQLSPSEFTFHPTLGYISLNTQVRPDEVLAVAYQYSYQGRDYTVGELTEDNVSIDGNQVMIMKLLKPSTIKTRLKTWDLMMKNVYQLGTTTITRDNFQLRVIYKDDLSGADLPNLQEGQNTKGVPLIRLTGLDRLNPNNDPFPDGNFDFIDGVSIDTKNGRVIFPVLEPFGKTIEDAFIPVVETGLIQKYAYTELYDSTKSDAQQIASKNKYYLKGRYQSGQSSEIILPGINIAPGSVTVMAGSAPLVEGSDYEIDYNLGRLRIKNQGVLQSNQQITVRFEKQDFMNFRRKTFIGTRFDYKVSNNFYLGSTVMHQTESPNISRVNIGDEPSKNTIVGVDGTIKEDSRFLTKMIDKLPIIQTKAVSSINFAGEGAMLIPGYPKLLNKSGNEGGTSYIDDFEGAETPYDLTKTPVKWRLGTTPLRFPDALADDQQYAFRRAKLAWYAVDNSAFFQNKVDEIKSPNDAALAQAYEDYGKNPFVRMVFPFDIYQNKDRQQVNLTEPILDLAYYPGERGPYNNNGNFGDFTLNPKSKNWGAITREIRNDIDFDNANIQYIEFWMMSPFMNESKYGNYAKVPLTLDQAGWATSGSGELYFNLGSISEDVMKDSKHAFENGLPIGTQDAGDVETNEWGKVTTKQFLTNAFDNSTESRALQDVGLDGVNDVEERTVYDQYASTTDPAADNFVYYLGDAQAGKGILERYKNFNGLENNSPINTGQGFTPSNSTLPDNEDLNSDNTINELEEYYEYRVKINPNEFKVGQNHIVDKVTLPGDTISWYLFRIPVRKPDSTIGNISGYKSIRFMRMYMTGFSEPTVLRFAQFQLSANQWRVFNEDINPVGVGIGPETSSSVLTVSTVNIEENGSADTSSTDKKIPYTLPPGFQRDQDVVSQTYRRMNEQSLQLCIDNLEDGKGRGAYKNVNLNLINYRRLKMFIHGQSNDPFMTDGMMHAILRVGTDYLDNYYEIAVPLKLTKDASMLTELDIWPLENTIDVAITDLTDTKGERNRLGGNKLAPYSRTMPNGMIITVVGNPDISTVQTVMIGLQNPSDPMKRPASACIWADELRVTDFVNTPSYATTARLNLKLADLATVNLSGKYTTVGWGALDQKVSQRERVNTGQWGVQSNIALDKFIPSKLGIRLPLFVGYDQTILAPKYDPLDPDILLKNSLSNISDEQQRAEYKQLVIDKTTNKSINFTNVQKVKTKQGAKKHLYDVENLSFTAAYSNTKRTNINIKDYDMRYYLGGLAYNYSATPKTFEPFSKAKWTKGKYMKLVKDINVTPLPTTLSFRSELARRITRTQYFEGNPLEGQIQDPFFEKQFTFTRNYGVNWTLTKSINLDYKANAYAIIDEPNRDPSIDSKEYKDSVLSNILRLGRLKTFDQAVGATYKVPIDKFPMLDWVSADLKYNAGYNWTANAINPKGKGTIVDSLGNELGNFIKNNQTQGIQGRLSMDKLYSKSKFLKNINTPPPPKKQTDKDTTSVRKKDLKLVKATFKTLMMLKSVNFTYDLTNSTQMGGYLQTPKYFGLSDGSNGTQMLPFVLGSQNPNIRQTLSNNEWLSRSTSLNSPFMQSQMRNLAVRAQIEPMKDLKIQADVSRKTTTNYMELYKDTLNSNGAVSVTPNRTGSITISIISIKTAFGRKGGPGDPYASDAFNTFAENRSIIRNRLPNGIAYDTNAQDVLIPAFLAAYTGTSASKVKMGVAPTIPLPNWRIDYTGLTKLALFKKYFTSLALSHSYTSLYTISNYNSSLQYGSDFINPNHDINNTTGNLLMNDQGFLVPFYVIEGVTITEAFNPLIGVNFRTKKKLTGNFQLRKSRTINLNLNNGQVQEAMNTDIAFGLGLIKTGVRLIPFNKKIPPLKNEMNFKMDVVISDRKIIQRRFEQTATLTSGNLNLQIRPNITYAVSQRVNVMAYFERTVNTPRISSSFKNSTTRFGVQVRFTLS